MSEHSSAASQLAAFALVAALRTATDLRRAFAERRAGHDPSAQESEPAVRTWLAEALPTMQSLATQLRVSLVVDPDPDAFLVQAFEDRLALAQLGRALHVVHQRLLSLYPAVPESLVEETRLRQQEAERLASQSGPHFERLLTLWLDHAANLFEGLGKVAGEAN